MCAYFRSSSYNSRLAADTKFVRIKSAEGKYHIWHLKSIFQRRFLAPSKQRRSLPAPKEPKIYSALGKVRQNILNSPYFNPKQGSSGLPKKEIGRNKSKQEADLKMCNLELKKLSKGSKYSIVIEFRIGYLLKNNTYCIFSNIRNL